MKIDRDKEQTKAEYSGRNPKKDRWENGVARRYCKQENQGVGPSGGKKKEDFQQGGVQGGL